MNAAESVVQIMDSFDGIYSPVPQAERMKATREALAAKVHEKESPDSYGYHIRTEIVIDEVVKFMETDGPVSREELVPLFLGILDVTPAELGKRGAAQASKSRVVSAVTEAAKTSKLTKVDLRYEEGKQVYVKKVGDWVVALGYFPGAPVHHLMYGSIGVEGRVDGNVMVSMYYTSPDETRTRYQYGPKKIFDLDEFMKSRDVATLAARYGVSYCIPQDANGTESEMKHTAHGGFSDMVKELEGDLANSPYSADKLIKQAQCPVDIISSGDGLNLHLFARDVLEYEGGGRDVRNTPGLGFVLGVDFKKISKDKWEEAKKTVPLAFKVLDDLKGRTKEVKDTRFY